MKWRTIAGPAEYALVEDDQGQEVARCYREHDSVYAERNAQTIALLPELLDALKAARDHLDYCGYGDAWERECAKESGLQNQIEATIANTEALFKSEVQ